MSEQMLEKKLNSNEICKKGSFSPIKILIEKELKDNNSGLKLIVEIFVWVLLLNVFGIIVSLIGLDLAHQSDMDVYLILLEPISTNVEIQMTIFNLNYMYFSFSGFLLIFGVLIMMQNSILPEIENCSLSWLLSNPISRMDYIIAKYLGNISPLSLYIIIIPSIVNYLTVYAFTGIFLPIVDYLIAIILLEATLNFYVILLIFLSVVFQKRPLLIGIFLGISIAGSIPGLSVLFPITLSQYALLVVLNIPLPTYIPFGIFSIEIGVLVVILIRKFKKMEF